MHFRMHDSGLHYYDPDEYLTFVTTVADNRKNYIKQKIKVEERAEEIYGNVTYPSVSDYRWYIHSNKIKECPVTAQDIDVSIAIWGKDIFFLKVNKTRKKTIPVTEDLTQVPKELIRLHRDIIMKAEILFVNTIKLFLNLSRNCFFTTVKHLADRKANTIYTAFNAV